MVARCWWAWWHWCESRGKMTGPAIVLHQRHYSRQVWSSTLHSKNQLHEDWLFQEVWLHFTTRRNFFPHVVCFLRHFWVPFWVPKMDSELGPCMGFPKKVLLRLLNLVPIWGLVLGPKNGTENLSFFWRRRSTFWLPPVGSDALPCSAMAQACTAQAQGKMLSLANASESSVPLISEEAKCFQGL